MKQFYLIGILVMCIWACSSTKSNTNQSNSQVTRDSIKTIDNDTVRIANEEVEYEIIIIEPGFNTWLQSTARPEGFYTQSFLEGRNIQYVTAWNQRVLQPQVYNPSLYEMQINYSPGIDYGYDVNYKLYNYFIYFQLKYKQQLTGIVPRI
ncbi:DUF6146 family protein [Mangrovimonas sp. ST2L15]|uniref:DUF6146 family protein n=1 Tax=Mangrovimonas sp. ST2L15 TaxID=1645916 RepID=UPI0006B472AC|nr:DUF6146 family protein [Mangrovimonas sp. ST2L15]